MHLLIMGPPGAGKGTQAGAVADRLEVPTISTGQIFRDNIAARTSLGQEVQGYLDAGDYVPDEVTDKVVRDRLSQADARKGFLLDGYPRTLAQVETLDEILTDAGSGLDRVVELTVDTEEVVRRLTERAAQEGRSDDTEDVVRRRLEVYGEQTEPLLRVYGDRGLLVRVDGEGAVETVTERLLAALSPPQTAP